MLLYYSQTITSTILNACLFQYLMKLYYSQTVARIYFKIALFQYLMKLHYSQTYIQYHKIATGFSTL